jgi:hypothetical protein
MIRIKPSKLTNRFGVVNEGYGKGERRIQRTEVRSQEPGVRI